MHKSVIVEDDGFTRVVSIDPGINVTGYGVLENKKGEIFVLVAGTVRNAPREKTERKLNHIYQAVSRIFDVYLPHALVLEDVFYHKNIRSTLKLGEVRGACSLIAAQRGVPVFTYTPRRVKKAVVGSGAAAKVQVQRMVQVLLKLKKPPLPLDVSDALALGITFFQDQQGKYSSRGLKAGTS